MIITNMNVISDYQLSVLADNLIEQLLSNKSDFFSYATVVCPNRNIRQWFKGYWLNNRKEILMNVNFVSLEEFLFSVYETNYQLANSGDIKNILLKLLNAQSYDSTYDQIKNYLFDNPVHINHSKLYELAGTLASLYSEYECEDFVSNQGFVGWEKELYVSLLEELEKYNLTTLSSLFRSKTPMKANNSKAYLFGFLSFKELHGQIIDEYAKTHQVIEYQLKLSDTYDDKYSLSSSPSISKEIEVVHSKICELLKSKDNKPTDFLVVGNSMSNYENAIKKTFNQDDENFPYIPYSISGSKSEDSDLTIALKLLIEIINKGFFTRLDFYNLINNNLVKSVRDISDEQIEKWMDSIHTLNVYRGDASINDDWDYIRKRILLSKISDVSFDDNIVIVNNKETIPYSVIGLDNDSIIKFVSIIDDLRKWYELFKNVKVTDKDSLLNLRTELKKWFAHPVLKFIDKRYKKVDDLISYWIDKDIIAPLQTLLFLLLDASKLTSISYREPFTTGVTFVEFNELVTYHQKYVFFINCGSNSLPSKKVKSELDLRPDFDMNKDEKQAFLYQYQNGARVFFSYINADLKKDAELFESTFSKDLRTEIISKLHPELDPKGIEKIVKDENDDNKYSIDEKRNWEELYSRGEYNKKDYREGLSSAISPKESVTSETIDPSLEVQETRNKVSVSDLAKLLEEPLSAKANYLFGQEDDSNEKNHDEFEKFSLDALENYSVISSLSEICARHAVAGESIDNVSEIYKKQLILENKLPNINDDIASLVMEGETKQVNKIIDTIGIKDNPSDYELLRLPDLLLNCNGSEWVLTCNKLFVRREQNDIIDYYELKIDSSSKPRIKFLLLYVISLMDIALRDDDKEYAIRLNRFSSKDYTLTSKEARETLNIMFELLNKYDDSFYAYLDFNKKDISSFNNLVVSLEKQNGPWDYFSFNKLFNKEFEIGYDRNSYKVQDYYDKQNLIAKNIKYVGELEPDPVDEIGGEE